MIRVAIYDDHLQRCESLSALIRNTGDMECVGAFQDCNHVEDEMLSLKPDIVLMDIEMPGTDGINAVWKIKKNFPQIRIIMQTVFDDAGKIFASLQAGAEGFLLKNAGAEKIVESIREVYNGGASMTPSVALRVMKYFNQLKHPDEYRLTPKEKEVLFLLAEGNSYKMVADKMDISFFTVNAHIRKIYEKLHVHSVSEAISFALKNRIV